MRGIAAYLISCLVAAILIGIALVIRYSGIAEVFSNPDDLVEWVLFLPTIALVISLVMAIPSFAMVLAVAGAQPPKRTFILFGAISGAISLGMISFVVDEGTALGEIGEIARLGATALLFILAGMAAGATYWALAGRQPKSGLH